MPPLYAWYSVELGRLKLLPLSFDPVVVAEFDRKGAAALSILDTHLAHQCFLVGHAPTIADVCCYADIAFARLGNKALQSWPNVTTINRTKWHGWANTPDRTTLAFVRLLEMEHLARLPTPGGPGR